eukprot:CFRG2248T1
MGGNSSKMKDPSTVQDTVDGILLLCAKRLQLLSTQSHEPLRAVMESKFSGGVTGFGDRLYDAIALTSADSMAPPNAMDIAKCLQLATRKHQDDIDEEVWAFYWNVFFSAPSNEPNKDDFGTVLNEVYNLTVVGLNLENESLDCNVLKALVNSANFTNTGPKGDECINLPQMLKWGSSTAPRLYYGVANHIIQSIRTTIMEENIHPDYPLPTPLDIKVPVLETESQGLCRSKLWALSLVLPSIYTTEKKVKISSRHKPEEKAIESKEVSEAHLHMWESLYDSTRDGTSYTRLRSKLSGYNGPTALIAVTDTKEVLGVFADTMWTEQKDYFGGLDARSLYIGKQFRVCGHEFGGSLESSKSIADDIGTLYMSFRAGKHLGIGHRQLGVLNDFDVFISSDFANGSHRLAHHGYVNTEVKIRSIEVWGCAGSAVKNSQIEHNDWEKRHKERLLKVKRPGREFWDDNPDKALLEMAGVTVDHSQRGDM